jgi:beta-lactamase class A
VRKRKAIALLAATFAFGCQSTNQPVNSTPIPTPANPSQASGSKSDADLSTRLKIITDGAGGAVSVTVIHVETGHSASVNGSTQLPLYSVFKLPLAIAVLKDVEEKKLQIDQKVYVAPSDTVAGSRTNTDLWQKPRDLTVAQLINFSIALSDNTSSDKLLELVGGPEAVTRRMRSLGFEQIQIQTTVREFVETRKNPNTGSADDLGKLLALLQNGELLQSAQQEMLLSFMQRATTGLRRIRGDLPAGTVVADKTGSGEINETTKTPNATNDVGLVTLPDGGHLAIAVLLNGSPLSDVEQEKPIAELARAAYEAFVARNN